MTLPRGFWDRHIALIKGVADAPRPIIMAEVVDVSRYSTVGASFIGARVNGEVVQAYYADGPAPAIGALLPVRRGDAALDARWYAWPLPRATDGGAMGTITFYFRVNGILARPDPQQIPPNIAGSTLSVVLGFGAGCANVYVRLRSFATGTSLTVPHDTDQIGPVNGEHAAVLTIHVPYGDYTVEFDSRLGAFTD